MVALGAKVDRKKPKKVRRLELRIEEELHARAYEQSERLSLSVAGYIRLALVERLERDEQAKGER